MLQRISFWGWFLVILALCYAVFNPTGLSLVGLGQTVGLDNPFFWLLVLAVIAPLFLIAWHTLRSINILGYLLYFAIVGVVIWALSTFILPQEIISTAEYWSQIVIALLLTFGLKGAKIRRDITSTVQVEDPDTVEP